MASKKRGIRKRDARVLLSDVLPYEVPPSFNNRGLYNFLNETRLRIDGAQIMARNTTPGTAGLLSILLGRSVKFPDEKLTATVVALDGIRTPECVTIPFQFSVRHRSNDYRTLTVPHPAAQLEIVDFYKRNAELMLYHTGRSRYSLRHPSRVARYSVVRDWLFAQNLGSSDSVEQEPHEYQWLRSYFTYKRYSNVYKFYDSVEYRSCERKYGFLVKADVAKCFDSIYTHTVAWATHGHTIVKQNLNGLVGTFGDDFDKLMQRLNHNETSGITVGSELSRIFAEIILQAVDRDIYAKLAEDGFVHGSDYEILRYVDDYFIFLANPQNRPQVLEQLARSLRVYKLHLNAAKEVGEHTPWMSPLTVAKERTSRLVRKSLHLGLREDDTGAHLPSPFVRAGRLTIGYKSILLDTGVSHLDLANYALARSERAAEKLIKSSVSSIKSQGTTPTELKNRHVHSTVGALIALIDFVFFAYSGAPRMSPAVKVARIVSTSIRYSRLSFVPDHERERLEMCVRDELLTQLVRARKSESPTAVTATLIDCLTDLGAHYRIREAELAQIFSFERISSGELSPPRNMNVLLFFSILMHIRNAHGYAEIRASCNDWLAEVQRRPAIDAERAIASLNSLACPYVDGPTKASILAAYEITSPVEVAAIQRSITDWNVNWETFDLYAALQQKRLYEVY